jgi:hypothetical protein
VRDRWRAAAEMPWSKEETGWRWSWAQEEHGALMLMEEVEEMW